MLHNIDEAYTFHLKGDIGIRATGQHIWIWIKVDAKVLLIWSGMNQDKEFLHTWATQSQSQYSQRARPNWSGIVYSYW